MAAYETPDTGTGESAEASAPPDGRWQTSPEGPGAR
jgi:hypothetical protein